jgi:hypothetical protein
MQLVAYESKTPKVFEDSNALEKMICIVNLPKAGTRRLYTLWKNKQWKEMIQACCSTAVGGHLFNVALWTELSRHRVEDVSTPTPCLLCHDVFCAYADIYSTGSTHSSLCYNG